MGCGDLGMAKPSLDRQEIHARPEKLHRKRVPENVRRYGLAFHAWLDGHGFGRRPPHDVCRAETCQALVVGPTKIGRGS